VKLPRSVLLLAQYFHPDSLDGDQAVEDVLCLFTHAHGAKHIAKVQQFMAKSLASGDERLMRDQWEKAESAIDFEDHTTEFFRQVVNFDPALCLPRQSRWNPMNWLRQ